MREHTLKVMEMGVNQFAVLSESLKQWYRVSTSERTCECKDYLYRHHNCKHLMAADYFEANRPKCGECQWCGSGQPCPFSNALEITFQIGAAA